MTRAKTGRGPLHLGRVPITLTLLLSLPGSSPSKTGVNALVPGNPVSPVGGYWITRSSRVVTA
jgi:hypothetical protein